MAASSAAAALGVANRLRRAVAQPITLEGQEFMVKCSVGVVRPSDATTLVRRTVVITNPQGLHLRPAATFAKKAREFAGRVNVIRDGKSVNGKSQVELLLPPEVRRFDRGEVRPFDTTHVADDERQHVEVRPSDRTSPLG